jgi:hypothetical protein
MQNLLYLCGVIMGQRRIYHIVEWVVALAACGWLVWKMATYDDYATLWSQLQGMNRMQWAAIGLCIALMPVNMSLEAWRWRFLMNGESKVESQESRVESISWREAHRQVYYSKLAGLITPWRIGEYPARALMQGEWRKTLSMGAVGSATMTAVIIVAGLAAWIITDFRFKILDLRYSYLTGVAIILLLLGVGMYFAPRLLRRWAVVSHRLVAISMGQSVVRLLCWCVQLGLVLWALNAVEGGMCNVEGAQILDLMLLTPVYYLLVTITPNVPIAEVGVRGAWAIAVFGTMNAALAGVLLWGINTLLPCVGFYILDFIFYILDFKENK